jgi:hypothetical protein
MIKISPTDKFTINEIPLESLHVEDMQVERVCFNTVKFAICCPNFRLSLIKVWLSSSFTIQLLNLIATYIEKIAMVSFLIWSCKTAKD